MVKLTRRHIFRQGAGLLLTLTPVGAALVKPASPAQSLAVCTWPTNAYTRVTLESNHSMKYQHFMLGNPNRSIVDIQGVEISSVLQDTSGKVLSDNPFTHSIRAGQNTPSIVRIAVGLKQSTYPQVFALAPVGNFRNRLVIDLYPHGTDTNDLMMALLSGSVSKRRPNTNTMYDIPTPKSSRGSGGNRRPAIMLDPSHGGENLDTIGSSGLKEKNVVLPIARETEKRLEILGYNVFTTRNEDTFIPLSIRVTEGHARSVDVLVSIYADAFISSSVRDTGVYMFNTKGATSSAAKFLARIQNNVDTVGGVQTSGNRNVGNTILDMTQIAALRNSHKLGYSVLIGSGKLSQLHRGRVDEANFAVPRAPDVPPILVETAFLSSPAEEWLFGSESFRQQCAQATASGIQKYINTAVLRCGQWLDEAKTV